MPIKEIDAALKQNKVPALTVIPLRLVTIHAVVPFKDQLAEIRRALRLTTDAEAKVWGPWYDGFEVQRRVSKLMPNGEWRVVQEWPDKPTDYRDTSGNYNFEERYIQKIDTRSVAAHFDEGYVPYFLKPEFMLAMPLPALAKDLNVRYPDIKLKAITDNIEKLQNANKEKISQSDFQKQLSGSKTKNDLYKNKGSSLSGFGYDDGQFGTPGGPPAPPGPGTPGSGRPADGFGYGSALTTVANEVENFLLRFVDCDVEPGYRYEYRIRLRMLNPNFKQDQLVAVPEYAKESFKVLYSKWIQLDTAISVPPEAYLYAHDVKAYREATEAAYQGQREMLNKMQVKDNQAVLQIATWMQQVRTDNSSKREPVGTWVVSDVPVGRGEFVGRKQYVKLPLWSSENARYVLREVADKVFPRAKEQPKGWLVDFTRNRSILVDFDGGRVKTRLQTRFDANGQRVAGQQDFTEDAATEVLILREDGKLVVRNSAVDAADPNRVGITTEWDRWLKEVEKVKAAGGAGPDGGPFNPKN